jgi:hypothetical protein
VWQRSRNGSGLLLSPLPRRSGFEVLAERGDVSPRRSFPVGAFAQRGPLCAGCEERRAETRAPLLPQAPNPSVRVRLVRTDLLTGPRHRVVERGGSGPVLAGEARPRSEHSGSSPADPLAYLAGTPGRGQRRSPPEPRRTRPAAHAGARIAAATATAAAIDVWAFVAT